MIANIHISLRNPTFRHRKITSESQITLKKPKNIPNFGSFIIFVSSSITSKRMKRIAYILFFLLGALSAQAQTETDIRLDGAGVKDFGGFILDMGTMLNAESLTLDMALPPLGYLPSLADDGTPKLTIQPEAFRLNPNLTYMGGTAINPSRTSILSLLYMGIGSGMVNWQGASYKLNNGMRINFYGEYDADGRKVYNPSAMPWQKNNFNAAFEMKSANGNFGIKVEVHGGRNNPY